MLFTGSTMIHLFVIKQLTSDLLTLSFSSRYTSHSSASADAPSTSTLRWKRPIILTVHRLDAPLRGSFIHFVHKLSVLFPPLRQQRRLGSYEPAELEPRFLVRFFAFFSLFYVSVPSPIST